MHKRLRCLAWKPPGDRHEASPLAAVLRSSVFFVPFVRQGASRNHCRGRLQRHELQQGRAPPAKSEVRVRAAIRNAIAGVACMQRHELQQGRVPPAKSGCEPQCHCRGRLQRHALQQKRRPPRAQGTSRSHCRPGSPAAPQATARVPPAKAGCEPQSLPGSTAATTPRPPGCHALGDLYGQDSVRSSDGFDGMYNDRRRFLPMASIAISPPPPPFPRGWCSEVLLRPCCI
jgi:hypothetical protein